MEGGREGEGEKTCNKGMPCMQLTMIPSPVSHGSQSFTMYSPKGPQHNWVPREILNDNTSSEKTISYWKRPENKCAAPLCLLHYSKSHKVEAI